MNDAEYGELLQSCIDSFRRGGAYLGRLVTDVESISESISDEAIQDRVRENWWTLEQVYAAEVAYMEVTELSPESAALVEESVADLSLAANELAQVDESSS